MKQDIKLLTLLQKKYKFLYQK